jgi:hypothetical protein
MMEVMLYMGIVGLMSVGSFAAYNQYNAKIKRTKALDQLDDIVEKAGILFYGRTPTSADLASKLAANKLSLTDPWGNAVTVAVGDCIGVTFKGLGEADCRAMSISGRTKCDRGPDKGECKTTIRTTSDADGLGVVDGAECAGTGACQAGGGNAITFYYDK